MITTQTVTERLVSYPCATCGVLFGFGESYDKARRADGKGFVCPNGHSHAWDETEAQRLKKELAHVREQAKWYEDAYTGSQARRQQLERVVSAKKGTITKLKKRAANGVCPCCTRTFANMARHMASKHPGFGAPEPVLPESSISAG